VGRVAAQAEPPELSGKSLRLGAKRGIVTRLDAPRRSEFAFETIRKFLK
jgi:hypothetical protein